MPGGNASGAARRGHPRSVLSMSGLPTGRKRQRVQIDGSTATKKPRIQMLLSSINLDTHYLNEIRNGVRPFSPVVETVYNIRFPF